MNEIDLFPDDLRKRLLFMRWFKLSGISVVFLTIILVAVFVMLREVNAQINEEIEYFQSKREITTTNRNKLEQLNQQKSDLQQQLDLLGGLRSGASAEQMFLMIDRALPGPDVWLTSWKFRRAGTQVDETEETLSTGYFIVIPAGSQNGKKETWKIDTHMTIQGQALDHSAMSRFVLNLTQQAEIEKVRIVNTRLNQAAQVKLVDFSLEVLVSAKNGKG